MSFLVGDGVGVGVVFGALAVIQSLTSAASGDFGSSSRNLVKASSAVVVSPALIAAAPRLKKASASFGVSAVISP